MAITVYATRNDFSAVLPTTAWGARTVADVDQALADASSEMDDFFRGRYPLPFSRVGQTVAKRCAFIARYLFLGGRGFAPETDSDKRVVADYEQTMEWLDRVQRRVTHPDVTVDPTAIAPASLDPAGSPQPIALSLSVVDMNGRTAPTRGW